MQLKKYDKTGTHIIGKNPDRKMIEDAINSIDWSVDDIVGVSIEKDSQNWADGSGSLLEGIGLSMMIEDNGVQHVAKSAPENLETITDYLTAYSEGHIKKCYELLYEKEFSEQDLTEIIETATKEQKLSLIPLCVVFLIIIAAVFYYFLKG